MSPHDFENQLRERLHREPFHPFAVYLTNGDTIAVNSPQLAIGGGGASLLTREYELVEFNCEDVREFRSLPAEASAHVA